MLNGKFSLEGSARRRKDPAASKSVVVTVLGFAEFVEEEDHGL